LPECRGSWRSRRFASNPASVDFCATRGPLVDHLEHEPDLCWEQSGVKTRGFAVRRPDEREASVTPVDERDASFTLVDR
jgi:hypothetical protein